MINCNKVPCITALLALPRLLGQQEFMFHRTPFSFIYCPESYITCITLDYVAIIDPPIVHY